MAQFARPNSDITTTSWTPSTGTTIYQCIDESTASDTDYGTGTGTASELIVGLSSVLDPGSSSGHIVRLRAMSTGSGAGEKWTVELYQGTSLIATIISNAPMSRNSFGDTSYTLTSGESDSITNYGDLRLRFVPTTMGASESIVLSFAEMEFPDAFVQTNIVLNIITNM